MTLEYSGLQGSSATVWTEDQFSDQNRKTCLTFVSVGTVGTLFTRSRRRTAQWIRHIKPQSPVRILNLEINTDCVLPCLSDPKLCIFTVSPLLFCICDVRPVKWVTGSVRRWCARWGCEKAHRDGENPSTPSVPRTQQVI